MLGGRAAVDAVIQLQLEANPFAGGAWAARAYRPVQTALREVIGHIASETPVVVVSGAAGTGKTLLVSMAARACAEMGLSVRQFARGDIITGSARQNSDLLLIDEADSLAADAIMNLLPSQGPAARTIVFLCLPANARRFAQLSQRAATVNLAPLTSSEARAVVLERAKDAGQPDLFSPGAILLLVEGVRGVPRLLRSVASLAYFSAAKERSCEIGARHVAEALDAQLPAAPSKIEVAAPPVALPIMATPQPPMARPEPPQAAPKPPSPPPAHDPIAMLRARMARDRARRPDWVPHVIGGSAAFAASIVLVGLVPTLIAGGPPESAQASALPERTVPSEVDFEAAIPGVRPATVKVVKPPAQRDLAPLLRAGSPAKLGAGKLGAAPLPRPKPLAARPNPRNAAEGAQDNDRLAAIKDAAERAETEAANRAESEAGSRAAIISAEAEATPPARDPAPEIAPAAAQPQPAKETPREASRDVAVGPPPARPFSDPEEVARQAEIARIAAERAREAKEAAERRDAAAALAARQAVSRDSMRSLFYSLFGVSGVTGR